MTCILRPVQRAALAAVAGLLMSCTGAFAADLYGGNGGGLKDGAYPPAAPSGPARFYVRGDFGYGWNDFGSATEAPSYVQSNTSFGNSHSFGGGIGMYFSPNVRGDLTFDWGSKGAVSGDIIDGAATVQGTRQFGIKHMVGLANLYYDFDTRSRFTPYLGVGLGLARNTTTDGTVVISGCDANVNGVANCSAGMNGASKTNAAGALMAGFSARIADRWSLDAGYRFLYTGDAQTGDVNITRIVNNPIWPQSTPAVQVHDAYEQEVRVGLRMDLR